MRDEACAAVAPRLSGASLRIHAHRIPAALLVLLLASCAAQPLGTDTAKIDRVLVLIQQRLSYMEDVARIKWNSGAPIEDLPREREIIANIGKQAGDHGLNDGFVEDFFRAQIEAAKTLQNNRFREWRARSQPAFVQVRDLNRDIRPALDILSLDMLAALAEAMPELRADGAIATIETNAKTIIALNAIDAPAREQAVAPLLRVGRGN